MSKLRQKLLITFAILSFCCTTIGALARLEHWPYWLTSVALASGLLLGVLAIVLLFVRTKTK